MHLKVSTAFSESLKIFRNDWTKLKRENCHSVRLGSQCLYVQGHYVKVPLLRLADSANVDIALLRNARDYVPVNTALRSRRHEFLANRREILIILFVTIC